jgi:hypothetical protein
LRKTGWSGSGDVPLLARAIREGGSVAKATSRTAAAGPAAEQTRGKMGNARSAVGRRNGLTFREVFGAGDRDRTDDIQLGKLTFYH